jgi:integrase
MGRSFYLYKDKKSVYHAEILDPLTGARICYRTTGTKSRDEAVMIVSGWLYNGIPARKRDRHPVYQTKPTQTVESAVGLAEILKSIENTTDIDQNGALKIAQLLKKKGLLAIGVSSASTGNQNFVNFLYHFWDYSKSEYLQDKRDHGKSITQYTCLKNKNIIKKNWEPYFTDKTLSEITREDLRKFCSSMRDRLSGKTINNIFNVGSTALKWAYREKLISENISDKLGGYVGGGKKRDILTPEETDKLFKESNFNDHMAYAGVLLAAVCGLRSGEIRAIRGEDIGNKLYSVKTENGNIKDVYLLSIRHSWNPIDTLKLPKGGEEGTVQLLPEIRNLLLNLLDENPYKDIEYEKRFVFWGIKKDRPCGAGRLLKGLRHAIKTANIYIGSRKIDLHSLRHLHGTMLLNKTGDIRKVALSLRHKSQKMSEHYTDHIFDEDVANMGATAADAFSNILNFKSEKIGA